MRFVRFRAQGEEGLAIEKDGVLSGFLASASGFPGSLDMLVRRGSAAIEAAAAALGKGERFSPDAITYLPPFTAAGKIICVGLNYRDHSAEAGFQQPDYPTLFARFNSSLIGHKAPLVRPLISDTLDYEGELVAVIGQGGRKIARAAALSHVAGYSIFNDGSVREFQTKTPQWTMGKNFDGTGAFGPAFVTADELPPGGGGLHIETRLNGKIVQSASTDDLVFDVATLITLVSEGMTLAAGDLIVTGTPSGVGHARNPKLYMKPGDLCEVEIEKIGVLSNRIVDEAEAVDAVA